jgi:hypothetical protein
MEVSYIKDQGQIYLDRIDYTSNYVRFYLEDRTDNLPMYTTKSEVITAKRLESIEIYGNGSLARKYELSYSYSDRTPRSILSAVTHHMGVMERRYCQSLLLSIHQLTTMELTPT